MFFPDIYSTSASYSKQDRGSHRKILHLDSSWFCRTPFNCLEGRKVRTNQRSKDVTYMIYIYIYTFLKTQGNYRVSGCPDFSSEGLWNVIQVLTKMTYLRMIWAIGSTTLVVWQNAAPHSAIRYLKDLVLCNSNVNRRHRSSRFGPMNSKIWCLFMS